MSLVPNEPATTGLYPIIDVAGRHPHILTDFIGATTITVTTDGEPRRLGGVGGLTDRGVVFHQKDAGADGRDLRVWAITEDAEMTFWAEPHAIR